MDLGPKLKYALLPFLSQAYNFYLNLRGTNVGLKFRQTSISDEMKRPTLQIVVVLPTSADQKPCCRTPTHKSQPTFDPESKLVSNLTQTSKNAIIFRQKEKP